MFFQFYVRGVAFGKHGTCHVFFRQCQQLLRGRTADEYPMIWTRFLVPFESSLSAQDVRASARLHCIEMIKAGITSFADAGHPLLGALRERNYQYNMPVRIGRNCWLGAGVIVLPGVTIGDNTVVGAGSVVTKDLPSNVLAVGTPARVLREIGDHDRAFYFKDRQIDPALLEGI